MSFQIPISSLNSFFKEIKMTNWLGSPQEFEFLQSSRSCLLKWLEKDVDLCLYVHPRGWERAASFQVVLNVKASLPLLLLCPLNYSAAFFPFPLHFEIKMAAKITGH